MNYIKKVVRRISVLVVIVVTLAIIFGLMVLDFLGIITPDFALVNSIVLSVFCIFTVFFKPDIWEYHNQKADAVGRSIE